MYNISFIYILRNEITINSMRVNVIFFIQYFLFLQLFIYLRGADEPGNNRYGVVFEMINT